jgi:acetoin utilization deacetylase AcuC-like enzyme
MSRRQFFQELKVAFDQQYVHPLPKNHRFPMEKYHLLPTQLVREGTMCEHQFFTPQFIDQTLLSEVHCPTYLDRLVGLQLTDREQRVSGFVHSTQLIERECRIMEGTRMAAELALDHKAAMNIAGGTHHAFKDRAEGFCLLNDQVIAAEWLLKHQKAERILIIDLDVHQGNGTAAMCVEKDAFFTFSMHGKNNYPLQKEQSSLDIELEDGTDDKTYLYLLEKSLNTILNQFQPQFVFYQCGVDILESDKLGKLSVTLAGCKRRDEIVFEAVRQLNVPIVCTMGGGYSQDINIIVEAHASTFRSIQEILF